MSKLLCKIFIKNHEDVSNPVVRTKHGNLAGVVGIISNLLLFTLKFSLGIISGCISITADAVNNLSDMGSSIITVIGFKMAGKKPDKEHPFGHERIEYIMGLIVSLIIILIGFELAKSSVDKIINPTEVEFNIFIVVCLLIAILVKVWQALFNFSIGKKINSVSLIATASDSRNDVIATFTVLIGLIISHYCKVNLDGYFGLLVAAFIMFSGFKLVKETMDPLIGIKPDKELVSEISHEILSYDGILGIHDMIAHIYGQTKIFMTVHCEVSSSEPVMKSHELIDDIERDIKKKFNIELTIHLDPIEVDNEELKVLHQRIKEILNGISPELAFHDLRMVLGVHRTNVIFDVVVPYKTDSQVIVDELTRRLVEINPTYCCIINIDEDFVE